MAASAAKAQRLQPAPEEPRVLLLSMRGLAYLVGYCAAYEFEDLAAELTGAEMVIPENTFWLQLSRRNYRAARQLTGSRRFASAVCGAPSLPVDGTYELFMAQFNHPHELFVLNAVDGWRRRCGFAACYLGEAWEDLLPVYLLELLRDFDHIFVGVRGASESIARITGRPCTYLPMGVDALGFCPLPTPPARTIDVCGIGRRSVVTHAALLELARRSGLFYYYDTIRSNAYKGLSSQMTFGVSDHREHRALLASLLKRSRYFIVNRAWADEPGRTHGHSEIAARFYEGAAAGAVLLGNPPDTDDFRAQFGWPDAVVPIPFDAPNVGAVMEELDADPARIARIRQDNVANTLLQHDWAYRLRAVLQAAGLPPTRRMLGREARLARLAEEVRGSPRLSVPA